jgi:hypothetical protein
MRLKPVMILALSAGAANAQVMSAARHVSGATISGVVRDSVTRAPLAGAVVQLIGADNPAQLDRSAVSDSLGRFTLDDVPDGRHKLGFFHPMLDSLGVDAPLKEVFVNGVAEVKADLAIPSAQRIRKAICGKAATDSGTLIVGVVRNAADGTPVSGAQVMGEWVEMTFRSRGMVRRVPRIVATTGDNGWFAMCNVPSAGVMALLASRGADSTDIIDVSVPPGGFLRHELYLGSSQATISETPPTGNDLAAKPKRHVTRRGGGTLSGTIVAVADGKPVRGAHVSLVDGPETEANERGEWTLTDAPPGTRMLDVRALGFVPSRRHVDIVSGAAPVRVSLSTLKAVLDTVKITATRLRSDDNGFEDRRQTGLGRYLTPEDIAKQNPGSLSEVFRSIPGLRFEYDDELVEKRIRMRSGFGSCEPAIYINGQAMTTMAADSAKSGLATVTLTSDDIDTWLRPRDVTGIEIYAGDNTPVQYQQGMSGCGSILIWTKLQRH